MESTVVSACKPLGTGFHTFGGVRSIQVEDQLRLSRIFCRRVWHNLHHITSHHITPEKWGRHLYTMHQRRCKAFQRWCFWLFPRPRWHFAYIASSYGVPADLRQTMHEEDCSEYHCCSPAASWKSVGMDLATARPRCGRQALGVCGRKGAGSNRSSISAGTWSGFCGFKGCRERDCQRSIQLLMAAGNKHRIHRIIAVLTKA